MKERIEGRDIQTIPTSELVRIQTGGIESSIQWIEGVIIELGKAKSAIIILQNELDRRNKGE